jgi:hypothetical protein
MTLYRPTGIREFELIMDSDFKSFPPRLEWQPIFYPVLNQEYAEQIALEWNTQDKSSGYCGIVTKFDLSQECYSKYEVQNVGGIIHNELSIPAEELTFFNQNIVGGIHVLKIYFGEQFVMPDNRKLARELARFRN